MITKIITTTLLFASFLVMLPTQQVSAIVSTTTTANYSKSNRISSTKKTNLIKSVRPTKKTITSKKLVINRNTKKTITNSKFASTFNSITKTNKGYKVAGTLFAPPPGQGAPTQSASGSSR
jgi:hypothetical protein